MNNNNNFKPRSTPPSYVAHYGMLRDPFSQEIENDIFYPEPSRKQRLGTLQHLTQFGNELMIVTGPKGSGKTTLLRQFIHTSPKTWKFSQAEAENGLDERKILQQLYKQMDMEFRGATHNDLLEQMKMQFEILQRKGQYCILCVNDADLLPVTAIQKIMEMATLTSSVNKPLLRIILFGTEAIIGKLNDPLLDQYSKLPIRAMELPAFTEEQTAEYVLGRLSAANFSHNDLFTPSVLHKLHTESYGWPARINESARKIITNSLPKNLQESPHTFDSKTFHASRLAGLVLTISVVVTFFIFQNDVNQWVSQFTGSNNNANTVSASQAEIKSDNEVIQPSKPAAKPAVTLVEKLKLRDTAFRSDIDTKIPAEPVASQTIVTNTVKPKADDQSKFAIDINTIPRKEPWVLNQNSNYYTLQIVAGENLRTIEEFIGEHKLFNNIAFYRSVRKNKPWYGLIYGVYPHKQDAASAITLLPKNLQRLDPWVRSMNSIQIDINKTRP